MEFVCARAQELPMMLVDALAEYRFQVFVERLGWELPSEPGYETDEFDRPDTVHLMARNEDGHIVGCGRLLPTTGPYLLERVFPQLLNGLPVPRSPQVWELSRFAAMPTQPGVSASRRDYMAERVLLQALRHCASQGVTHLLAVSTPAVERLLLRAGVQCQRLGPPELYAGQPVLAFVIAVSDSSLRALEVFERAATQACNVERAQGLRQDGLNLSVLQDLAALARLSQLAPARQQADFGLGLPTTAVPAAATWH
jgi:acyl homoserine lactone synthase